MQISQQHRELICSQEEWMVLCSTGQRGLPRPLFPSPLRGKQLQALVPLPPAHLPHSFLLFLRVGPLAALDAVHSVTVLVRANFLTAKASTASALRSSSDEDPESLPFGERPAPRAHMLSSLRGLRTPFSGPLELQMDCLAHWPGNQQWRTWDLGRARLRGPLSS